MYEPGTFSSSSLSFGGPSHPVLGKLYPLDKELLMGGTIISVLAPVVNVAPIQKSTNVNVAPIGLADLRSRKRRSEIALVRWDLAALAVGRFGHRVCDLAVILNKNAGSVSRWLTEAERRQASDREYRTRLDCLERRVVDLAVQNITM